MRTDSLTAKGKAYKPEADTNPSPNPFAKLMATFVLSVGMAATDPQSGVLPNLGGLVKGRYSSITESSTADEYVDPALVGEVRALFEDGAQEFFEDGMESSFSKSLLMFFRMHGRGAVRAISGYVFSGDAHPDVTSEALRSMADWKDKGTLAQRWHILQRSLHDKSPRVRDGAIFGFANMNDPRALGALSEARSVETVSELRKLIDQVIAQLEQAR